MRTCIISGGMIEPDFAFPYLQKQQFDIILAADRGLEFCYHYQIMPTYILGDFVQFISGDFKLLQGEPCRTDPGI